MRALISVFDKTGIVEFAKQLSLLGVEIISSGGTYDVLKKEQIPVIAVEEITHFAECLDGRVKTLHPRIHAGILANRQLSEHMDTLSKLDIQGIEMVVCNLYPFAQVIAKPNHTLQDAIENIDIGGPSMIRAAAKNYQSVYVVTNPADYNDIIAALTKKESSTDFKLTLAQKAFAYTAKYDALINHYLYQLTATETTTDYPEQLTLNLIKKQNLRYGENPHQTAAFYQNANQPPQGVAAADVLHGKALSYNNIVDAQAAIELIQEFDEPACVAIKHATPCGVAIGTNLIDAYKKAFQADPVSIFGGIVCVNQQLEAESAALMSALFLEVIIAPSYTAEALTILTQKKNVRLLKLADLTLCTPATVKPCPQQIKSVGSGFLIQSMDYSLYTSLEMVTHNKVTTAQQRDLDFAFKVVKHVKSNAIVIAKDGQTLGVGGGEVSRIAAAQIALAQAGEAAKEAVMASDAFFPFADVVELAAKKGIVAIIQPGSSINDQLSIDACHQAGIAMQFTHQRHFKH